MSHFIPKRQGIRNVKAPKKDKRKIDICKLSKKKKKAKAGWWHVEKLPKVYCIVKEISGILQVLAMLFEMNENETLCCFL